jgi:hypothetical protein
MLVEAIVEPLVGMSPIMFADMVGDGLLRRIECDESFIDVGLSVGFEWRRSRLEQVTGMRSPCQHCSEQSLAVDETIS